MVSHTTVAFRPHIVSALIGYLNYVYTFDIVLVIFLIVEETDQRLI